MSGCISAAVFELGLDGFPAFVLSLVLDEFFVHDRDHLVGFVVG